MTTAADSPFAEYDLFGRKQPRRFELPDYLLMIARIEPARVRAVPATAISEDGDDDDGPFALLECPCSHRPVVRKSLGKCSGCQRYYTLVAGRRVFVAYGEMAPPPICR